MDTSNLEVANLWPISITQTCRGPGRESGFVTRSATSSWLPTLCSYTDMSRLKQQVADLLAHMSCLPFYLFNFLRK